MEKYTKTLQITDDPNTYIRSERLTSVYYYNNNFSSKYMFRNMKTVLRDMGFPDELFIKLGD